MDICDSRVAFATENIQKSNMKEWKHLCCFISDLSNPGGPLDHHSLSSEQNFSDISENIFTFLPASYNFCFFWHSNQSTKRLISNDGYVYSLCYL